MILNPLKNEIWMGLNRYFPKDAHQKSDGVSEVRLKKLDSFALEMSKNHLIRNFLRNRRLRVKLLRAENRRALKIRSRNCRIGLKNYKKSEDLNKIKKCHVFEFKWIKNKIFNQFRTGLLIKFRATRWKYFQDKYCALKIESFFLKMRFRMNYEDQKCIQGWVSKCWDLL